MFLVYKDDCKPRSLWDDSVVWDDEYSPSCDCTVGNMHSSIAGAGMDCAGKLMLAMKCFTLEVTHAPSAYLGVEV